MGCVTSDLIDNLEVAKAIKSIIELYLNPFDILYCKIWDIGNPYIRSSTPPKHDSLGYDIAYSGGDYFSAIKSGLFTIDDDFAQKYRPLLNKNGLLNDLSIIDEYISEYKAIVPSEANAVFDLFELELVMDE